MSSRSGANVNYYLETFIMFSLFVPFVWLAIEKDIKATHGSWRRLFILALAVAALFTGLRVCRGEYFRWKSLKYYREIVEKLREYTDEKEPCFSVYPELAVAAGREYYFNNLDYDAGSSSKELGLIMSNVLGSGKLAAIISHSKKSPSGYHYLPLSEPPPFKFYPVFLHLSNHHEPIGLVETQSKNFYE